MMPSPEAYLPDVLQIAATFVKRCPRHVELDDVIQAGAVGLLQAIPRYDASKGTSLRTFARYRIQGAILDAARGQDVLSRNQRQAYAHDAPVEQQIGPAESDAFRVRPTVDAMTLSWLRGRLNALPIRERFIIRAYYFGGLLEREIAEKVNVSPTGVNYLRRQALKRMAA